MSGGAACRCRQRSAWRVAARQSNASAFNGYRETPSAYSEVRCLAELGGCSARWRTKAAYVADTPDDTPQET